MPETLRRISTRRVKAAYARTKLVPKQGDFWRYSNCRQVACGLGAVAMDEKVQMKIGMSVMSIAKSLGLSIAYVNGFTAGFDGAEIAKRPSAGHKIGYSDGHAAAAAVFDR